MEPVAGFCKGQDESGVCLSYGFGPIRDEQVCVECKRKGGYAISVFPTRVRYKSGGCVECEKKKREREHGVASSG